MQIDTIDGSIFYPNSYVPSPLQAQSVHSDGLLKIALVS